MNELITDDGEIVETGSALTTVDMSMASTLARAEIDSQITTARQYPRSAKRAIDNILTLATLDETTATENIFALKRGNKPIRGPSIRLAEIVAQCWGNCRVDARVIGIDRVNKIITAEGLFHDLEANVATRATVQRRISDKNGRLYNDDMIAMTGNAACSIAKRNAILGGVPKGVWRKAVDASEQIIKGDVKTLVERRDAAIKAFAMFGLSPAQVFEIMDVAGEEDIDIDDLVTLRAIYAGLKSGEQTVEELLRKSGGGTAHAVMANPLKDDPAPDASKMKAAADAISKAETAPGKSKDGPADDGAPAGGQAAAAGAPPAAASETAASGGDSGTAGDDDADAPATEVSAAYLAGQAARKKGTANKPPKDLSEADAADWKAGWSEQDAAMKAGG